MAYLVELQGGGILNNLTIKFPLSLFLVSMLTTSCAATTSQKSAKQCVEHILKVDVVRVDDINHRLFIVSKKTDVPAIKENITDLEKCFVKSQWQKDWSLSVFTDAKYAGYKDEENIIPHHKNNMWAKAYLLEYGHSNKSLIKEPALNPEQIMP